MSDPLLELRGISKHFAGHVAVAPLDLSIARGELFCLLGASGCGKSTLLRVLAGFEAPDTGRILFEGRDITEDPPHLRPLNMMFQSYALFPHLRVRDNIAFGLKQARLAREEINRQVAGMLSLLQLEDCADRYPRQISGGQRQRVALARALARRPPLLLLDEPLGALDRKLRENTREELRRLQAELGTTFILVTHDQEEALSLATRMAVMSQGRLLQVGRPHEIYARPTRREVAEFLGRVNLIDTVVDRCDQRHVHCSTADTLTLFACSSKSHARGAALCLALRPEQIRLGPPGTPDDARNHAPNHDSGTVTGVSYLGHLSVLEVRTGSGRVWRVQVSDSATAGRMPAAGDRVGLSWDADALVVLDA